jgi:fibronectin-binding autotransporter adhesin
MMRAAFVRYRMHGIRLAGLASALMVALAAGPALGQTRGTWNVDADGTWSVTSNWLSSAVAGGVGGTANFTNNITATRTVTLDTSRSLGSFVFGDADTSSAASWIVASVASGTTMTMNNGANSATITVNALGTGATATISAVLGASGTTPSIIKDGVGTLVLSATNNFTNKLAITSGTLQVGADRNLGAVGTFATDRITISNGAALRTSAAFTLNAARGITIGSGGGTISPNSGVLTIAAPLTGSGNTATVAGNAALTLQNTSGTATNVNWDFGGTAGVRAFFEGANALGTGTVRVRNAIKLTSQSMTTGTLTNAVTLDDGAGITARSSGGAQTYTDVALPSTGSLLFNNDDQLTAALTIASGKELTGNLTISTQQGGANAVGDVTLSGIFSGASGALIKSGTGASGRLILAGANTYAGNTTINTGTLQLGNGGTVGSLSTSSVITGSAGATLAFNRSDTITSGVNFKDAIIGGINIAQVGSGTVILTAANTIGKTSITNGTLQISAANQLGAAPGAFTADQLTISSNATLRTTAGLTLANNTGITIGSGGGKLDVNGANLIVNSRFTGAGQLVTVTGSTGLTLVNSTGVASNVNWDFAMNSGQRVFFSGTNSNALGSGTVTVRNGTRLVIQNSAPPSGEVTNAVTLESGAGLSARSSAGAVTYTNVALPSTGSLIFNRDDLATAALTIASGTALTGDLTIDTSQQAANVVGDVILSGNFSGASGGITKIGTGASGKLILGGVNTYGGNTTISTGTLALGATASIANSGTINLSAASTTFDVSAVTGGFSLGAAQALAGVGTVVGDVTALGKIAPGLSPGTLTFANNLSLDNGAILNYELSGTDTTVGGGINDLSSISGNLTLGGTLNVTETVAGSFLSAVEGDSWRIFSYTGTLTTGVFSLGSMPTLSDGKTFQVDTSTANQVNLVVVPEPATIVTVIAGLGMLGMVAARRRIAEVRHE